MTRAKLAQGIFTWAAQERRSDRYGAIYLGNQNCKNDACAVPEFYPFVAESILGKRVRLTAVVLESRDSVHVGDLFLQIKPSRPDVGEEIDLGVGVCDFGTVDYAPFPTIILKPGDGRDVFWYHPAKLYRLHDQTVALYAEETADEFSPRPLVGNHADPDLILSCGDGYIQAKKTVVPKKARATVKPIGDGAFLVVPPGHGPVGSVVEPCEDER